MKNFLASAIFISIITVILFGCINNTKPKISIPHLNADTIKVDSGFFGNPYKILITDSLMFIQDEVDNRFFAVLDIKNLKFLKRFGRKGNGPNEIMTPLSMFTRNKRFSFNTMNSFVIADISIDEIINSSDIEPAINILTKLNIKNMEKMYSFMTPLMNENKYLSTGFFSSGKYALIDINQKTDSIFGAYPPIDEDLDQFELGTIFQSRVFHHPSERKVVNVGGISCDLIEVISYNKNNQIVIKSKDPSSLPTLAKSGERIHISRSHNFIFVDSSVTDKYIYLLYSGKSFADSGEDAALGNEIHVYDWELKKVCEYVLDFDLQTIGVSPDDKYLYSFGAVDDNMELLKWELVN